MIRFELETLEEVALLQRIFRDVGTHDVAVDVEEVLACRFEGIEHIYLIPGEFTSVELSGSEKPTVFWQEPRKNWLEHAFLIDVFRDSGQRGHHYLFEGENCVSIVVAYKEASFPNSGWGLAGLN